MKFHTPLAVFALVATLNAAEAPKVFAGYFEPEIPVKGQIGVVLPPPEINTYVSKVEKAAKTDPKWFREYSTNAKPGAPLPYDERLGLTKTEYEEYLVLWNKREFRPVEDVMLVLRQTTGDTWALTSTGAASVFSTLRYSGKDDTFTSPNGALKRIEDIKAEPTSILGEWTGQEWKFEEDTGLSKIKENFALGKLADKKYGIIVYRGQEMSTEGTKLLDKSLVVRFVLGKAGQAQPPAAAGGKPTAPAGSKPPAPTASKPSTKAR